MRYSVIIRLEDLFDKHAMCQCKLCSFSEEAHSILSGLTSTQLEQLDDYISLHFRGAELDEIDKFICNQVNDKFLDKLNKGKI